MCYVKQGAGGWAQDQQQTAREIEIDKFIAHRSQKGYTAHPKRPPGQVKAEDRERERVAGRLGHAFIRVCR